MHTVRKLPHIDGDLGWLETAPNSTAWLGQRMKGDQQFDIAVIGAGFTGIATALRLAELNPNARIALIDALRIGEGTSGRNAGFLIDLPHNVNFEKTGAEHANSLFRLNTFAIDRLRQLKDKHSIPSWVEAGKYMACREDKNLPGLDHFEKMLKQAGFNYEKFAGAELAKRLGTSYYQKAIYTTGNVLVNPATLVRGLIEALPASVTLFENSPVHGIEYGPPHTLQFLGGTIRAGIVVQAVNSFGEQFGTLNNRIAPIFTYASLTEPLPESVLREQFANVQSWGLTSAHLAGTTVRFTHDNRIFVRNTYDYLSGLKASDKELQNAWRHHRRSFESRFPFVKQLKFDYTWGGMICMTQSYEPIFFKSKKAEGTYVISGCNGVGVVKGTYLGYYMADYINGRQSKDLDFILKNSSPPWIPGDPLRAIGAKVRIAWEAGGAKGDV